MLIPAENVAREVRPRTYMHAGGREGKRENSVHAGMCMVKCVWSIRYVRYGLSCAIGNIDERLKKSAERMENICTCILFALYLCIDLLVKASCVLEKKNKIR